MVSVRLSAKDTPNYPGVGYDLLVRRAADGAYHDFDDNTFKTYGAAVSPFLAMTEDADVPGIWTGSASPDVTFTGEVDVVFRETPGGAIHSTRTVYLSSGIPLVDLARPEVLISTHTGGFEALAVVDSEGAPVEGAIVRVYDAGLYDSADLESNIIGMTSTDARGYWHAAVPVSAGGTYIVHVHKYAEVGPATTTVSV